MVEFEKIVIIGAGIAGLTSAIYAARAGFNPLVLTGMEDGGQLMLTTGVENFPGFPDGINGPDLVMNTKKQAEKFGARFKAKQAEKIEKEENKFKVFFGDGSVMAEAIIIATGASARWLGLSSEEKYKGRGVSTCATCDGFFYKDKLVAVIGGGDSACEEALTLTKFASKVTMVHRRDELRASKIMAERVKTHDKISIIWDSAVEEVLGDESGVTGLKLKNTKTGEISELKVDGMFLGIGHVPNTKFLSGFLSLDVKGYIDTPDGTHTSVEGVFVAGDVADPVYKQAISAAGSGCKAAIQAEKYLEGM